MPPPPLPGTPGSVIKSRLESAAIRFEQVFNWEELRAYILQDEKWVWDNDIVLGWQQDITTHFLECCKDFHDDEMIQAFTAALKDGQQFQELRDADVKEAADLAEQHSAHNTITQQNFNETVKFDKIIFVVRWGNNKNYDGLTVKHTDKAMSKIIDKIVQERWNLDDEVYSTLVGEGPTGRMMSVIDLTWELQQLQKQGPVRKSYTTTFMLVPDHTMKSDAELGQNKFDPPCSSRQKEGHSTTKSLPNIKTSGKKKAPKSGSQAGKSSPSNLNRRRTMSSISGRSGSLSKEEFIQRKMVAGLRIDAELQWEKEQLCLETDAEDDESFHSSKGKQQSSLDTSVDSKDRAYAKRGRR